MKQLITKNMTFASAKFKFIGISFFLLAFLCLPSYAALSGTYYVDATDGNDLSTGKTETEAWKTFSNINKTTLLAGTKILLKRGSVWNQRMEIRGSGTIDNWIAISAYGTSDVKPKISLTNNKDDIGILICDLDKTTGLMRSLKMSYIEIADLEISNTRLGIYYRSIMGTQNTGFRVKNITFNNINCDEVMLACNAGTDKDVKHAEITRQLGAIKGNLQTTNNNTNGGAYEYIFPAAIFVGGKTAANQRVSGTHTTVLTELEVSDCEFNEAIAGVMSVFYWPFTAGMGADAWRQIVNKVKVTNCTGTGVVNGMIAFDGVNGGAVPDAYGVMQPDADGWGLLDKVSVKMGSAVPGRTWPDGTTGVILSNVQNFLFDNCEFSDVLNQGNPDGCGFDFETNDNQVTLQNTKFLNNDGHAILMMNGGGFGGSTHIKIQNNLFAKNIKSSSSLYELELSDGIDGHSDIIVRNNISFLRKTNKNNFNISFYNTNRTYVSANDNDIYYLDEVAQPITISFLGQPYTFNSIVSSVSTPVISTLWINDGELLTTNASINIKSKITKGAAAYYKVSENNDFISVDWQLYSSNIPFDFSSNSNGLKTIYFKVKNVAGESYVSKLNVSLKSVPEKIDANDRTHPVSIKISPNPVIYQTKVMFSKTLPDNQSEVADDDVYQVTIMTLNGTKLEQIKHAGSDFMLDLSKYPKGTFLVRIVGSKNTFTKSIIKN